ncbi:T9SS type A sorting domain-containing protein [Marinoscillum furvescens]|uniref:Putative secreted protein (Por secretion system target) n=1 Tax=Marinoscillum furvescens DSM 4134 TaxID=1122208 RepID=A0A3D9L7H8_MARFU|nr:T9SS type A sorting domain-containing protein [Marinoscillum furvescens]REE01071.1 putative secreted protein (Por secretion system target) [Marinoscillum furvescens DSM 4134]
MITSNILEVPETSDLVYAHGKTLTIRRGHEGRASDADKRIYRLMSVDGHQVWSGEVANELSVTFDHLQSGVYIINDGSISKKVVFK